MIRFIYIASENFEKKSKPSSHAGDQLSESFLQSGAYTMGDNTFEGDSDCLIPWTVALARYAAKQLDPCLGLSQEPPLFERKRMETYEEKKSNLSSSKKERLDRHIQLQAEGKSNDPSFFSKMRKQGTCSL
jgi:hypothetical protein